MPKNVFVSYKFSEKNWKDNALQFFQAWGGKSQATPVFLEDGDVQDPTNEKIKEAISKKLEGSVGLLIVIGNNSQHSDWVAHEVGKAIERNKKCAYTRYKNATGGVPKIIDDRKKEIPELSWTQEAIAAWIATL